MDKKLTGVIGKVKAKTATVKNGRISAWDKEGAVSADESALKEGTYSLDGLKKGLTLPIDAWGEDRPEYAPVAKIDNPSIVAQVVRYLPIVALSLSDDISREFMTGVCFQPDAIVGTDGKTLTYCHIPLWDGETLDSKTEFIVKFSPALAQALGKFTLSSIKICKHNNYLYCFDFNFIEFDLTISCNCVDQQFPSWKKVVPEYKTDETVRLPLPSLQTVKDHETTCKVLTPQDRICGGYKFDLTDEKGRSVRFNSLYIKRALNSGIHELRGIEVNRAWIGTDGAVNLIVAPMYVES